MKNTLLRTVVIFVALCIYPSIHAYDFECDGFYYDITSDSTVSVTHDHGDFYKGDISIPNQATHNGKTYQVTTIDDRAFEGKEQLTSVHISNSIDSIGDYAFCALRISELLTTHAKNPVTKKDCAVLPRFAYQRRALHQLILNKKN